MCGCFSWAALEQADLRLISSLGMRLSLPLLGPLRVSLQCGHTGILALTLGGVQLTLVPFLSLPCCLRLIQPSFSSSSWFGFLSDPREDLPTLAWWGRTLPPQHT